MARYAAGETLAAAKVQALVDAMAPFGVPPLGQTQLTAAQHAALDGLIGSSWI